MPVGSGSDGDPYLIESLENLYWMALNVGGHNGFMDNYFRQVDDIDASATESWFGGSGFLPIGGNGNSAKFKGFYDGQGHVITGLRINRPLTNNVGLFGNIGISGVNQSTEIRNLGLVDVEVVGARGTGTLAGRVTGNQATLIERCFAVGGSVTGDGATGGLVGSNNSFEENPANRDRNPRIRESFADIDVFFSGSEGAGGDKFGGLAGCNQKGTIKNSYARGNVLTGSDSGTERVGGLAGCIDLRGYVKETYAAGQVTGGTMVGGLIGNGGDGGRWGEIENSFWDIQTSGTTSNSVIEEGEALGKTTAEMQLLSTFYNADWGFVDGDATGPWNIGQGTDGQLRNDGYPYFVWQFPVDPELRVWTGPAGGNFNNGSNWTGGAPAVTDKAVIRSGDSVVLEGEISGESAGCLTLTVEPGAAFTVESGANIVNCDLIVNSGASLLNKGTIPVGTEIRFERLLTSPAFGTGSNGNVVNGHWVALGSPVSGSRFAGSGGLMDRLWTQGFPGSDRPSIDSQFSNVVEYRYSETGDGLAGNWHPPVSNDITPGLGFFVFLYQNKFRDDPSSAVDFTRPFTIEGPVNNFSTENGALPWFDFPELVYNGTENDAEEGVFLSWNMLSNPFGAGLDWSANDENAWMKQDVTEFAYIWDPSTSQYLVTSDNSPDLEIFAEPVIAPFQAFWVQATNGEGNGTPDPALRAGPDAMDISSANTQYFKQAAGTGHEVASAHTPAVTLRLDAGGFSSQTGLRFGDEFADGLDDALNPVFTTRDAWFLSPMAYSFAWIHSDVQGKPLLLKSLPMQFDGTIEIPVDAGVFHNGLPVGGPATITAASLSHLPDEWGIGLRDNHTGALINLRNVDRYDFTLSAPVYKQGGVDADNPLALAAAAGTAGIVRPGLDPSIPRLPALKTTGMSTADRSNTGSSARFTLIISTDGAVSAWDQPDLPARLELSQNYPNPFNPSTSIGYSLPEQTRVQLVVYDLLGRRVATLVDRMQEPGRHQVAWDAGSAASGVYIYRLEAGGQAITRRMTLVR